MAQDEMTSIGRLVVIGGSAGSLEVILALLKEFPHVAGVVLLIVVHRRNDKDSIMEDLLSYKTDLPVREVEDKDPIQPGHVYLAPPDYHLLIEDERTFSLDMSEKVHFSRPSIDISFESVAEVFGPRVIGILLSGANADGARGLLTIRQAGGHTLVQDPAEADIPFMPLQAVQMNAAMEIVGTRALGEVLVRLLDAPL